LLELRSVRLADVFDVAGDSVLLLSFSQAVAASLVAAGLLGLLRARANAHG
jgi:hypothetical protein